jgi:mRNA-degrading endonuclease RelE of RelBE toxin-antitoxin system
MGNSSLGGERWQMKKKKQREEAPASPSTPVPMQKAQYDVRISEEAQKGLDEIPRNIQKAMYDKIEQLKSYPEVSGIKRMWGEAYGKERMKFWDWRMEFTSDEKTKTILVTKVGHRDTLYDEYHHP